NQSVYRIHGRLDITRFLAAWQQLSDRHAVLRTAFVMQDGEWRQVAFHRAGVPLVREDWRDIDAAGQELKLQEWLRTVHQQGFPPKQAPLLRLALFQVADDSYLFIFSNHHVLFDGWSNALLLKEVLAGYEALSKGSLLMLPPARPYRDYIQWLAEQDHSKAE